MDPHLFIEALSVTAIKIGDGHEQHAAHGGFNCVNRLIIQLSFQLHLMGLVPLAVPTAVIPAYPAGTRRVRYVRGVNTTGHRHVVRPQHLVALPRRIRGHTTGSADLQSAEQGHATGQSEIELQINNAAPAHRDFPWVIRGGHHVIDLRLNPVTGLRQGIARLIDRQKRTRIIAHIVNAKRKGTAPGAARVFMQNATLRLMIRALYLTALPRLRIQLLLQFQRVGPAPLRT